MCDADWLIGGGEMGKCIRAMDWSRTPLGPIGSWPQSLRTTVSLCLASNFPISLAWGAHHVQIYNDGYWPICGAKHPQAMGQDFTECWASAWPVIGHAFEQALAGETHFLENQRMFLDRNGYLEETFFTFSFSPIRDESGGVGGLFHPVTETTGRMLSERRTRALGDLAARMGKPETTEKAFAVAAKSLGEYQFDLPFVLLYSISPDGKSASLVECRGIPVNSKLCPKTISIEDQSSWPVLEVANTQATIKLDEIQARFGETESGPYPEGVKSALLLPITVPGLDRSAGVMIAGISPRLPLDDIYRGFFIQIAAAVTAAVICARAYQDERERAERLAEIDRAKTIFFSNVSHEFRTPLTLMIGPLEEVLKQSDLSIEQRAPVDLAYRNSLRLLKLVNALLEFSRLEAGRVEATFMATDLSKYTIDLISIFRSAIEKANLQLVIDCPPIPAEIYVDRDMWEKIVLNLVSNAFKFTERGSITVRQRLNKNVVELVVEDTGTGIPAGEIENVFKRFHRIENARGRTIEGTGIGLALVQELVRLHGGNVRVESQQDQGSRFIVSMPAGSKHLPPDRIRSAATLSLTSETPGTYLHEASHWPNATPATRATTSSKATIDREGLPRVLLADDNSDMREYVCGLLFPRFNVVAVSDGLAALASAKEIVPDLILSDVMMPGLDGFALLKELRGDSATRAVPIVLLSARAGEESRVEGLEAGADDYLIKPFSGKELLARVGANIELAKVRKQIAAREQEAIGNTQLLEAERIARTEAEQASEMLRQLKGSVEQQARVFDTTLSSITDFAYCIDRDGRFLYANKPLLELYGLTLQEVVGKSFYDLNYPKELADKHNSEIRQVIATKKLISSETAFTGAAGVQAIYEYTFCPVFSADGNVEAIAGSTRDVTERKKIELERESLLIKERIARTEAEHASRMKDEFLATLSHELRTPLHAILGWSQVLKTSSEPADLAEGLTIIERNARAQTRIIEDLLDMSRIIAGKVRLDVQRIDLAAIVQASVDSVRPTADTKGVRLQVILDSVAGPVSGDPNRLQQIFWNLLTNAVKFTPRGGRIQIRLERVNSHLEISVTDTGEGIKPDFLPHVFDRFRQSDASSTRRHGGLGLGLAIVKQLAELHGGNVRAKSSGEHAGATFIVSLPLMAVQAEPEVPQEHHEPHVSAQPISLEDRDQIEGTKVLVVDDELDARLLIKRLLEDCKAIVTIAGNADEAFASLQECRPDVLISDVGMPGEDGYSLIKRIRTLDSNVGGQTPAVALTAYARAEDRVKAVRAGFQHHVTKPVEPTELIAMIASLTNRPS